MRRRTLQAVRRTIAWADAKVPLGVRSLLGLIVATAGVFGFLPVLGFWMIPLGLALIALDIPPLRRRMIRRVNRATADGAAGRDRD